MFDGEIKTKTSALYLIFKLFLLCDSLSLKITSNNLILPGSLRRIFMRCSFPIAILLVEQESRVIIDVITKLS